jgi:sugar lactone lactonase YvrE
MTAPIEVWDSQGYELAEGARRVDNQLLFVDILSGRLLEASLTSPGSARVLVCLDVPLGAVAPIAGQPGGWIVAAGTGIGLLSADGSLTWLERPEDGGAVASRMNDGACDPFGRFWAGSMAYDNTPGAGSLYRVDCDGSVTRVLDGLTIVNGPAFNAAGTLMYVADTPTGRIFRYSVNAVGDISDGVVFVAVPSSDGTPDGMTIDTDGHLWTALWGGSRVHHYDTGGELVEVVRLPARQPTSVCLTTNELFVTTAAHGLDDATDADGALLRTKVSASAPPAYAWGGRVNRAAPITAKGT